MTAYLDSETTETLRREFFEPGGFAKFYLMLYAHIPEFQLTDFHVDLCNYTESDNRTLYLGPRGGGKSTCRTVAKSVYELARNPDANILIGSISQSKAKGFGRAVKGIIETNRMLHRIFPHVMRPETNDRLRPWNILDMTIAGRTRLDTIEPSICIRSIGGDVVSKHFDVELMDDMVDEETARSETMRDEMWEWFHQSLLPCLNPGGQVHISGTRYHWLDIYGRLIGTPEKPGSWHDRYRRIPALDESGKSFWPERFPATREDAQELYNGFDDTKKALVGFKPFESLEERREEMGNALFSAQFLNDIKQMQGAMFKPEWFQHYEHLPHETRIESYMAVDLAIGQKEQHDYTAIITLGVDHKTGRRFVLGCRRGRWTFDQTLRMVEAEYKQWRTDDRIQGPHVITVEEVAYQAAAIQSLANMGLPVKGIKPTKDKVARARSLEPFMELGKVHFTHDMRDLEDELLLFPEGEHDDMVDALVYANDMAESYKHNEAPAYFGGADMVVG